ncbi:MAG: Long-chain-fatty-acid--CoA ligase [Solirubrobacterales bacterium]|nr:Long-chain-fatty-acid--CoA ligase [Solirubrobacterales bacterium]
MRGKMRQSGPPTTGRRRGRAVGNQRGRAFMASIGVLGLVLAAITFYVGYQAAESVPGRGYYDLRAQFDDANNLANHYEVRLSGVRAGQILNPHVENGKAVVDLKLDDRFKPLPADSQLQVRLRSAVGVRYLEIIPGKSNKMLADGDMIPSAQVRDSVALDEVLGTFDTKTRAQTSRLLRELGTGVAGRGTDLNDTIRDTPGLLRGLRGVSNAITARPGDQLSAFIRNGAKTAGAFDDASKDIVAGLKPETQALKVFTDAGDGVQGTLSEGNQTLASVRSTLPHVNRLVSEVGDLARRGRPALRVAPDALRRTTRLLDDAQQPLDDLKATLDLADDAVDPVLGLLGKVKPVLPSIDTTLSALYPQLTNLGPRACEISNAAIGWGHYLGIGNSETNFIRFQLLAVRPEQTAGQAGKGSAALNDLYDKFVNSDPYYGPCTNGGTEGATGKQRPVTARVVNAGIKPFNRTDNLPYETDPNIVASPSQIIQGGK